MPVARGILEGLGAREELIEEVCDIIAHHHHPRAEEDIEFKCVYDADLIANLEEKHKEEPLTEAELERTIADRFYTGSGKALAREVLMGGQA